MVNVSKMSSIDIPRYLVKSSLRYVTPMTGSTSSRMERMPALVSNRVLSKSKR